MRFSRRFGTCVKATLRYREFKYHRVILMTGPDKQRTAIDPLKLTYKLARRIAIAAVGSTILVVGVIMIVTPGPALVLIPVGLAILGLEFAWARVWLKKVRERISSQNLKGQADRAEEHRDRYR